MARKIFVTSVCLLAVICAIRIFYREAGAAVIPVTKFRSAELPGGAPAGWTLEKKTGTPVVRVEKEGANYYLRLISRSDTSFGVRRAIPVDVREFPILTWRWKVEKMPVGGDVRRQARDDQALQIYVAFKETGFPAVLNTPVIGYIWDNEAPKGWSGRSSQVGGDKMRYIVLRNKTDKTGQWYTERRNVYEDYKRLFGDIHGGEPLGPASGVQLHINSQHTRTSAESLIGDIYFSNEPDHIAATQAAKEKMIGRTAAISSPRQKTGFKLPGDGDTDYSKPGCLNVMIEFGWDSTQVASVSEKQMQTVMEYLMNHPRAKLLVTGHSDGTGSYAYNVDLSRRRAESVKKFLMDEYKIDGDRLTVKGVGPAQPIADDTTPEGQARNRRVMIQDCP